MKKKIFSILLVTVLLFGANPFGKPAQAVDVANLARNIIKFVSDLPGTIATMGQYALKLSEKAANAITAQALVFNKVAALLAVQTATSLIIGEGNDGTIIRDFNNYLYVSPQQKAMAQMNSFFNTVSRGRLSSLNYEGVGPNYDAYLVTQARQAITGQPFSTNLQDIVTDPTQMFAGGNMKGIMTYMQCANNVACYTLTSTAQYNLEYAKAQEIAKNENVNGFIPKKKNGRIIQPASLAQSALTQMDQLGTQITMSATGGDASQNTAAISQVWTGAAISATARLTNYGISDEEGQAAIRNKNDEFPFSLGYSANGGIGISAGGVTIKTGAAALSGAMQFGNICAIGDFTIDASGASVDIYGKKLDCPPGSKPNGKITKPAVTVTTPTTN